MIGIFPDSFIDGGCGKRLSSLEGLQLQCCVQALESYLHVACVFVVHVFYVAGSENSDARAALKFLPSATSVTFMQATIDEEDDWHD